MAFKEGEKLESMLHESGADIVISYRTGQKALIENGIIKKIYDHKNHHEMNWQLGDWRKQEEIEATEREQKQLEAFHKAEASKAAKAHMEADKKKKAAPKKKEKAAAAK